MVTPVVTPEEIKELRLKALLRDRGLTQAEVARRMDISPAQLTRLFKSDRTWKVRDERAFSIATKIKLVELRAVLELSDGV